MDYAVCGEVDELDDELDDCSVLIVTVTVFADSFAAMRSNDPLPVRSVATRATGPLPLGIVTGEANVPSRCRANAYLVGRLVGNCESRVPALAKSAATIPLGPEPAWKSVRVPNVPSPLPSRMETVPPLIGNSEVQVSINVEIRDTIAAGPVPIAGFLPVVGSTLAVKVRSGFCRRTETNCHSGSL